METFVRGKRLEAYVDAARKVDRALRAGAYAIGASVEITTLPGYAPFANDPTDGRRLQAPTPCRLVGDAGYAEIGHRAGSTDMGDLGLIRPIVHPYAGGASGTAHGADFASPTATPSTQPIQGMAMTPSTSSPTTPSAAARSSPRASPASRRTATST